MPPEISSLEYVGELMNAVPTSANVKYYADIVSEKAVLRRLIRAAEEVADTCYLEKDSTEIFWRRQKRSCSIFCRRVSVESLFPFSRSS